jgi:hypothetical protein
MSNRSKPTLYSITSSARANKRLGESGRDAPQHTPRPQRESTSSEDRWLDEGGREGPQ